MSKSLTWHFLTYANRPRRIEGLNDAGITTFRGDYYRSMAREAIQNSLDAKDLQSSRPVTVEFERFDLPSSQFPDLAELKRTFDDCAEFFADNEQTVRFFERAVEIVTKSKIPVLRIGDSGTTGLVGDDEDITSQWVGLTGANGLSGKGPGSGGSYGIGQNAPFAASDLRTVFYSTCTGRGQQRFLGVARLVTHKRDGEWRHDEGSLGQNSGESVTAKTKIPSRFLRTTKGTDLFVMGFKEEEHWERDLEVSVLDNFWPAIMQKDLVVKIGTKKITARNLEKLLESLDPENESDAYAYYRAYTEPDAWYEENLDEIGKCHYCARVGDELSPRKVAMIRQSGMVIYRRDFRFGIPYCGVFHCDDEDGNEILRRMEPPAHDKWDKDLPEKGSHTKVDRIIRDFIRECMQELQPEVDDDEIEIDELDEYLPDYENESQEGADPQEAFPGEFDKKEPRKTLPVDNVKPKPSPPSGSGDDEGSYGEGDSGKTGGEGAGGGDSDQGGGGSSGGPSVPVRYRAFPSDAGGKEYELHIRDDSGSARKVYLSLRASGDDILAPVRVTKARLGGKSVPIAGGGLRFGPVNIGKNKPLTLSVELADPMAVAMEVIAHEANS